MAGPDTLAAVTPGADIGAFGLDDLDGLEAFYRRYGFAVLRGWLDQDAVNAMIAEGAAAQARLAAGELDGRYGTTRLTAEGTSSFPNYVVHITDLSPTAAAVLDDQILAGVLQRWLSPGCWSGRDGQFGFVYQDARTGDDSGYSRIGWHSDWQGSPHLDLCPATAVTVHLDATSPANGFLRVVPGSQMWATPAPYENVNGAVVPEGAAPAGGYTDTPPPVPMPLAFDKVRGEAAVYADAGDVLFHDAYLWHSAARGTVDPSVRRHIRGSWFSGTRPERYGPEDFVKNAAR
jgi:ectoine hydroxylase-related dioxygenase (phytanoyl-CoA dioxygenase family)